MGSHRKSIILLIAFLQKKINEEMHGDAHDPVRGLLKLYAHNNGAIADLEKCRINPDFNSN
jgi:hypothetical protein